jgi:hypothetical protein
MAGVFEIAFAAGLALVGVSFGAVVLDRVSEKFLITTAILLTLGSLAGWVALGLNLSEDFVETPPLLLAAGGLLASAVAEAGLLLFVRALRRLRDLDRTSELGQQRLRAFLEQEAEGRASEQGLVLARERSTANQLLGEQERKLAQERRDLVVRQAEQARVELTEAVAQVQERLERRLAAWAADLDRGQRALETRLTELGQRQAEAASSHEARLTSDAEQLGAAADEQRALLSRLREDLKQGAREVLDEGREELEEHSAERRRALQELAQQVRDRERELRELVDREVAEGQTRLKNDYADATRRQLENLERSLERSANRLAEDAERRFDVQIKQSREKSAERLSHELDRAIEEFTRQAEKEISDRIALAAQSTAERLQKRTEDTARAAESQYEVAAERLRLISDRLDEALGDAEQRIHEFETKIESEVSTKLEELARAIRATQN